MGAPAATATLAPMYRDRIPSAYLKVSLLATGAVGTACAVPHAKQAQRSERRWSQGLGSSVADKSENKRRRATRRSTKLSESRRADNNV